MTSKYSVYLSSEQVELWRSDRRYGQSLEELLAHAVQWGADAELQACCDWLGSQAHTKNQNDIENLRSARRPNSPTVADEALAVIPTKKGKVIMYPEDIALIRNALEKLKELEANQ